MSNAIADARAVLAAVLAECESLAGSLAVLEHDIEERVELDEQIARLKALQGRLDALQPRYYIMTMDQELIAFDSIYEREDAGQRMSEQGQATMYLTLDPTAPEPLST